MATESLTGALQETLAQFDDAGTPRTTPEVAADLDLGRRSTYARLERLDEQGYLETKKVGANARVWWHPPATQGVAEPDWPAAADTLIDDGLDGIEAGIVVFDDDLDVVWVNEATERYFGLDRERVFGWNRRTLFEQHISSVIDDPEAFADRALARSDEATDSGPFECRVTPGPDRAERWLEHRSKPIDSGAYAGGRIELYYDVTARVRSQRAHREQLEEFESLVDAVDEYAIFTLDTDGHVQTWNPGASRIKGYDEAEILGEQFSVFYTDADQRDGVPEENLAEARAQGSVEDEGWRVRQDGSKFWATVTIGAIRDADGEVTGYAKVTRDMTERREYEQQLREEKSFSKSVIEDQRDIVYAYDTDGQLLRWNDRFREVTGYTDEELAEMKPSDLLVPDEAERVVTATEEVFDGESVTVEGRLLTADGVEIPYEFSGSPLTDEDGAVVGLTGIGRDVTSRKETEQRLKRQRDEFQAELDDIFERIEDGFYALDSELRFTYVNDWAAELLGIDEAAVIGQFVWDVIEPGPMGREAFERALDSQEATTFEQYYEPLDEWFETHIYPSESGLSVYFRDISQRKARERELERYEAVTQTTSDVILTIDSQSIIQDVNPAVSDVFGYEPSALVGHSLLELMPERLSDDHLTAVEQYLGTGERSLDWDYLEMPGLHADGSEIPLAISFSEYEVQGDRYFTGFVRDITERKQRERELVRYETLLEGSTDVNVVVDTDGTFQYVTPSSSNVFGYEPEELVGDVGFEYIHPDDREQAMAKFAEMLANPDYEPTLEFRFEHDDGSWINLEAVPRNLLDDPDIEGIVVYTRDVTDRMEREQQLVHQREQLTALHELNTIVRDVIDAVIEQPTREEIEATVCQCLAETDSYQFAWTGDADTTSQTMTVRAQAGDGDYLSDTTVSVDPDDEGSHGPTTEALVTGERQTAQYTGDSSGQDPWRDRDEGSSFQSSAAIPIVHDGTTYGVLNVYSDRPDAFGNAEETILGQLGSIVGHAIAAVERKRALMSDEVVELGFQVENFFDSLGVDSVSDARIEIEHTIQVTADEHIIFGGTTPGGVAVLESMVETLPSYEDLTLYDDGDQKRFELTVSEPPVLSVVASLGGSVEEAIIEDGDYRFTVHLPPSADVELLVDTVTETYQNASLLRQRQLTRPDRNGDTSEEVPTSELTDRQRTVLETAVHAGFFEWPREVSGEELAASIGVAPPTFHQHLRKAEQKMFEELLAESSDEQL